jgi:hypothetical protein
MAVTPAQFAEKVLQGLKIPVNKNAIDTMLAWMAIEGGHPFNPGSPFHYNPLNTTQPMPGSHSPGGPAGVQSYPDWATGLAATVKTLGYGYYTTIRASLAAGNPPQVTLRLPAMATWGTNPANWNPDTWKSYADRYKAVASPGSLGFPWGTVLGTGGSALAGAIAAPVLGVGLPIGAALGAAGYGAYRFVRRYV